MKIFRAREVSEIDAFTIEHEPVGHLELMERAATTVFKWIYQRFSVEQNFKIFVGPGNNGGDALVVARLLADKNLGVELYMVRITDKMSPACIANFDRLKAQQKVKIFDIAVKDDIPWIFPDDVVVDGLFGSGLSRPLEGIASEVVKAINASKSKVIAIDIPSGLFGEDNSQNMPGHIIKASNTLSFEFPNLSFFFAENQEYVGEWEVLPIGLHPDIIDRKETPFMLLSKEFVAALIRVRRKFEHKGSFGHGLLISGSYGKMGAAVLASKAALRSGIGLLTTHIPRLGYNILQTTVPEAMVSIDSSDCVFSHLPSLEPYNAIGIGPGIGCSEDSFKALSDLMDKTSVPLVIDADAINLIGQHPELKQKIPQGSVFTPHPKEFERLVGESSDHYTRNRMQMEFAQKYGVTVVLKGAYTAVACVDGSCYFNTTGNPGMATAGSGDVLTGIILSLLAQGYSCDEAALAGVFIHGLSADIATKENSMEALIAGDIVESLKLAWKELGR